MDNDYDGPLFRYVPNRAFRVVLSDDTQPNPEGMVYSLEEAEALLESLTEAVEAYREAQTNYVQVQFDGNYSQWYTYIDPTGTLEVGDLVEVMTPRGANVVEVMALGRGDYRGQCSTVKAKLVREAL